MTAARFDHALRRNLRERATTTFAERDAIGGYSAVELLFALGLAGTVAVAAVPQLRSCG